MHPSARYLDGRLPTPLVAVVGLAVLVAAAPLQEVVDEALDPTRRLADLAVDGAQLLRRPGAPAAAAACIFICGVGAALTAVPRLT